MNRRRQLASSPASIISAAIIFGVDHLGCHYLRRRSYRPSLSSVLIILSVIISSAAHPHRYHHHFNHRNRAKCVYYLCEKSVLKMSLKLVTTSHSTETWRNISMQSEVLSWSESFFLFWVFRSQKDVVIFIVPSLFSVIFITFSHCLYHCFSREHM